MTNPWTDRRVLVTGGAGFLGRAVVARLEAAGAQVVAREFTTDKATDFNAILTKIRATAPDVVFFGGMDAQAGPMLRQIKQLGINTQFLTGDGGCSPEMIKLAGDAINSNTYCSMAGLPLDANVQFMTVMATKMPFIGRG